jgi:hypothetical protein
MTPKAQMNPTAYAIRAGGTICRAEDDPRLCIFSDLADAIAVHQRIRQQLPDAQIIAVQFMHLGAVTISAPPITGVRPFPNIPAFAGQRQPELTP